MGLSGNNTAKTRPSRSSLYKFRPTDAARSLAKGTKPLAEAASVQLVLIMMVVHVCRKIIYGIDVSHKVGLYLIGTLIISVIGDFLTVENSTFYMAQADNFFNLVFVKWGWGWTLIFVSLFVGLTSYVTSCGKREVLWNQAVRLVIATAVWYIFTNLFAYVEYRSGLCSVTKYLTKSKCIAKGYRWRGFDISGHTFLLIWNNLFIIEEGRAYLGWERIKDLLRDEEHKRLKTDLNASGDPRDKTILSKLKNEEFLHLRSNYKDYTPYVRFLFGILALWVTLWDVMLFYSVLYFHITLEKVLAACLAIFVWFLLYRVVYTKSWSPGLPGDGAFNYVHGTKRKESLRRRSYDCAHKWTAKDNMPKFMGMPIYSAMQKAEETKDNDSDDFYKNVKNARNSSMDGATGGSTYSLKNRSRSRSRSRVNSISRSSLNVSW